MNELKSSPSEREAKNTVSVFNRLLGAVFEYDDRKKLSRELRRQFRRQIERWGDADEGWMDQAESALLFWSVCSQGDTVASLIRSQGAALDQEELAVARLWRTEPCVVAGFRVTRRVKGGFVEVQTVDPAGLSLWVYSPSLSHLDLPESTLVVTVLWKGLQAWHTYGPILDLPGFEASDLGYLLACANAIPRKVLPLLKGVPDSGHARRLNRNPVLAQLLSRWSARPIMQTPHGPARMYLSVVRVSPADVRFADASWWSQQARQTGEPIGLIACVEAGTEVYLGQGSAMHDPWFTYDPKGVLYLGAMSDQAYQRGRAFLPEVAFPEKSDVDVSVVTHSAVQELFPELRDQYGEVSDLIKSQSASPESTARETEELAEANRVMDRLMDNHNHGRSQTTEEIAAALGVEVSVVQDYAASIANLINKLPQSRNVLDLPPAALSTFLRPGLPHVPGWFTLSKGPWPHELLEASPALRLFRWLSKQRKTDSGRIKATVSGYLDPSLVRAAWSEFWKLDPTALSLPRPSQERQWPWLLQSRRFFEAAGLLGLDSGGFFLTDLAERAMDDSSSLLRTLLEALFTRQFFTVSPVADALNGLFLRTGGLLLYSMGHFARKSPRKWLTTKPLIRVLVEITNQESVLATVLVDAIAVRGPFSFLGLVEVHKNDQGPWVNEPRFRPTALYPEIFELGAE